MSENPKTQAGSKKPPLHLIPPSSLIHMSAALADGAAKHGGPFNWREPTTEIPTSIYVAAAMRHLNAFWDGEWEVPDSSYGASHLGAVQAGVAVLIDAFEVNTVLDDRPPSGTAGWAQESWKQTGRLWVPSSVVYR